MWDRDPKHCYFIPILFITGERMLGVLNNLFQFNLWSFYTETEILPYITYLVHFNTKSFSVKWKSSNRNSQIHHVSYWFSGITWSPKFFFRFSFSSWMWTVLFEQNNVCEKPPTLPYYLWALFCFVFRWFI